MQNPHQDPQFDALLGELPQSESKLLDGVRTLSAQGNRPGAIDVLKRAHRRGARPAISRELAALLIEQKQFDKSVSALEDSLRQHPPEAESLLILSEAQLGGEHYHKSASALRQAIQLGASAPAVLNISRRLPPDFRPNYRPTNIDNSDPDTQELDELEVSTLESNSLELNAFEPEDERVEQLDESDIFGGGSFEGLSSLQDAGSSPIVVDDAHLDSGDPSRLNTPESPSDQSVNELLVDLGLPVARQGDDDYNATHSIRGRVDEALGLQRDDLRRDESQLAERTPDAETEANSSAEFIDDQDLLLESDTGPHRVDAIQPEDGPPTEDEIELLDDADLILQADTSPHKAGDFTVEEDPPTHDELEFNDTLMVPQGLVDEAESWVESTANTTSDLSHDAGDHEEWDDVADTQFQGTDQDWDAVADTQFQAQMPHGSLPQMPDSGAAPADWRLGNEAHGYAPDDADDAPTNAIELDQFEIAEGGPLRRQRASGAARNRTTDRLHAVNHKPRNAAEKTPASPSSSPSPGTPPAPSAQVSGAVNKLAPFLRNYAGIIVGAGLVVGLVVAVLLVGGESAATADSIRKQIGQWRVQSTSDTYQDYLKGEQILSEAIDGHGPMGRTIDSMLASIGMMGDAEQARAEALAELVLLRAMIEYRFEYLNTRQSEKTLEQAHSSLPDDPRVAVARVYRLLAKSQQGRAVALLGKIRKQSPNTESATIALIHAQLDADDVESASMATLPIRSKKSPSVHEHYLLGRVDMGLGKIVTADARFRHIIATLSPAHLSARIQRSKSVRQTDDPKAVEIAATLLKQVLDEHHDDASPLQLAHAHNAMAGVKLTRNEYDEAENHYQQAIKTIPQRSAVYSPMVDLYIRDGRLEKALQLIKDAEDAGVSSTALLLQRAEIYRLTARPELAIQTIDSAELRSARSMWIKGLAHRDMQRSAKAAEDFSTALKLDEKFAPARAQKLLLEELSQTRARNSLDKPFEKLLKKNAQQPEILQPGARAVMHVAEVADDASRPKLLSRAKTMLEDALKYGGNPALINYDLCAQAMLAQDKDAALGYCEIAYKSNPRFLPGALTAAKLHLKRDVAGEGFFDDLAKYHPNDSSVSHYRALAWLNELNISKAETEINRWAGTAGAKSTLHLFAEGRLAFARQKDTAALGYFERAHKQSPHMALAAIYYARTLSNLGDAERAETILKPVLDDLQWGPIAWIVFGQIRRTQNRLSDASQNLDIAERKLEGTIASRYWHTQLYVQKATNNVLKNDGGDDSVERELQRATESGNPDDPALNMAWARYYLALRNPDVQAAITALKKVTSVQPAHCNALNTLKTIYTDFDDLDAADPLAAVDAQISKYQCEG